MKPTKTDVAISARHKAADQLASLADALARLRLPGDVDDYLCRKGDIVSGIHRIASALWRGDYS